MVIKATLFFQKKQLKFAFLKKFDKKPNILKRPFDDKNKVKISEVTTCMIELETSYEVRRLLPICHSTSIYTPKPDRLIRTATRYAELFGDIKDSTGDYTAMGQLLYRATVV